MKKEQFDLENYKLKKTYEELVIIINSLKEKNELPDHLQLSNCNNPDELSNMILERELHFVSRKYEFERIEKFKKILPEVYFARIDLINEDNEVKSYYVSKTGLESIGTIDWRSNIGALIYNNTTTKYLNNKILLKRKFDLFHDKLNSFHDIYKIEENNEEQNKNDTVSDSFLIKILIEKKNEKRITDIIKSIQVEQNNIIRLPENYNSIVLGCAGSGKTMILLHRLSYLKFYSQLNFNKIKIITPSNAFKESFKDLQRDLDIHDVEMMTITEYYKSKLNELGFNVNKYKLISEYSLNDTKVLEEIYSKDMQSTMFNKLKEHISNLFDYFLEYVPNNVTIEGINIIKKYSYIINNKENLLSKLKKIINNKSVQIEKLCSEYQNECVDILELLESTRRTFENKKNIDYINSLIDLTESLKKYVFIDKCEPTDFFDSIFSRVKIVKDYVESYFNDVRSCNSLLDKNKKEYDKALLHKKDYLLQIDEKNKNLDLLHSKKNELENGEYKLEFSYKDIIEKKCSELNEIYTKIEKLKQEKNQLKIYNFIKKERINSEISELSQSSQMIMSEIKSLEILKNNEKSKIGSSILEVDKKINKLEKEIFSINEQINVLNLQLNEINNKINKLNELSIMSTDFQAEMNRLSFVACKILYLKDVVKNFDFLFSEKKEAYEKYNVIVGSKTSVKKWFDDVFVKEHINRILVENKKRIIDETYKYNFYYVLLLLLINTFYRPRYIRDTFICIDEFQDLSKLEIDLIKEINTGVTLNLYGDLNQTILSKGFFNEKDFDIDFHVYHLNNNYRNTNQITNYYNKFLNKNDNPVGVNGPNINFVNIKELINIVDENSVLICHSTFYKDLKNKIKGLKVYKVEQTKGLEFNTVYVYDSMMSNNEKYISYSRALYKLVIVKDLN